MFSLGMVIPEHPFGTSLGLVTVEYPELQTSSLLDMATAQTLPPGSVSSDAETEPRDMHFYLRNHLRPLVLSFCLFLDPGVKRCTHSVPGLLFLPQGNQILLTVTVSFGRYSNGPGFGC